MDNSIREAVGSPFEQGSTESVYYTVPTAEWGGPPSDVSLTIRDLKANNADVTNAKSSGNAQITDDDITLPRIYNLTAGKKYRVDVQFMSGGNLLDFYFYINAKP